MHGITLTEKPADWTILQQRDGYAAISLTGTYQVHPAAIEVGVVSVVPLVRVMSEEDNSSILPWQPLAHETNPGFSGSFSDTICVPAGGLYRIETCLETKSCVPDLTWLYRGDCALHIGVGDLFIMAGQSNAAGYSRDYALDPPDLKVHLFRNRSCWDLACHPMNESTDSGSLANEEMGVPGVSPYLSFAKNYSRLTGLPVGLIQTTLGGSPISRWDPVTGDLYRNMLNKLEQTGGEYAGVLWYQGCSDTDPDNAPHYLTRFSEMVTALRSYLGYSIPFFTFQLNRQIDGLFNECWGMVRDAQRRAALELPDTYVLPTTNCPLCDGIHNNAHANIMLGEKLARQCLHVLQQGPAFFAPELTRIVRLEGNQLELTFSHMALGFLLNSGTPSSSSFLVSDGNGENVITAIHANRQDKNHIYLTLTRTPQPDACISFAWDANPTPFPIVDEVTYLPPLSFYQVPIY